MDLIASLRWPRVLAFAGADFKTLYATVGGKLPRRPTLHQGLKPFVG